MPKISDFDNIASADISDDDLLYLVKFALGIGSSKKVTIADLSNAISSRSYNWHAFPHLSNFEPVNAVVQMSAGVTHDLYTVPENKIMIPISTIYHNRNGSSTTVASSYETDGVNRVLSVTGSVSANSSNVLAPATLLLAGDILKSSSSLSNVNCVVRGYLADIPSGLIKICKFDNWSAGENTLYTCPENKRFMAIDSTFLMAINSNSCISIYNPTGSVQSFHMHAVPSGDSPSLDTQLALSNIGSNTRSVLVHSYFVLDAGGYLSMNVPTTDNYEVTVVGFEFDV